MKLHITVPLILKPSFVARDLSVDFVKIGLQTKALNQIIPFFNATIQGGDKLIRTMMNPNDRKTFLTMAMVGIYDSVLEAAGLAEKVPGSGQTYGTLQHAYRAIQASQREINNIWNDPSIDQEVKEKMIDDLYLQQIQFAKAANEDIKKHRLTQKDWLVGGHYSYLWMRNNS